MKLLLVDDGSTDNTWKYILLDLKKKIFIEKLKAIKFTRNFGHQESSDMYGIRKASGKKNHNYG